MRTRRSNFLKCFTQQRRCGSNPVDVVAILVFLGIGLAFLLVDLQRRREATRVDSCRNNIRNIGIAISHYHDVHQQLPIHGTGTHDEASATADEGDAGPGGTGGTGGGNNGKFLSFLVGILPHLEQQAIWDTIRTPSSKTVRGDLAPGAVWNAMGPATSQRAYPPWVTDIAAFRCPSDPRNGPITGRTNYAACLGDALDFQMDSAIRFHEPSNSWKLDPLARRRVDAAARGAFVFREDMTLSDITDGLSNTMLVSELVTSQGARDTRTSPALGYGEQTPAIPVRGGIFDTPRCSDQSINPMRPRFWIGPNDRSAPKLPMRPDEYRGMRWSDARAVCTGFNSILPPNSSVQVAGMDISGPAVVPPSSNHPGGAHVLLADGSTKFIFDSIDCGNLWGGTIRLGMQGDLAPGSPSAFGAWGALGTRAAND
ncbi:DUF1559 family PulG-like putative transporter [Aporhodopirellula aestuarii]|uniref:DUF1559 domain-containing protein n=1 Tax=Aporhodopirellula aestuarii TaxID=2950107 RepID=A0ABT0TWN0_9BACT|nr:DUF1559 domain-containing protein [Aporhodopirellula aestuarii]MCM2369027.1 DUF1559 domain-containing protein [Aporhodopirellula aestuarii]